MPRIVSTQTSHEGKHETVRYSSGRVFVVRRQRKPGDAAESDRSASIRSENLWRLGNLEEGTVFHASHTSRYPGKAAWVWGHATDGPNGHKLSYKEHSQCGWVLRANLHRPEGLDIAYKPPEITYKTWNKRVYRSIRYLWVNLGHFKLTAEQKQQGHKQGIPRKHSPVPARRAHEGEIRGYKNSGGGGASHVMTGPIGVRYLNANGWYMAHSQAAHWCFVHHTDVEQVDTTHARKYDSHEAEARRRKQKQR